jgi:hypothetical protein
VFGKEAIMLMEYWVPHLRITIEERWETYKFNEDRWEELETRRG